MKTAFALAGLILVSLVLPAAGELQNGKFTEGKSKWRGDGKVEKVEGKDTLVVLLSKNNFSETTQSFKLPSTVKRIKITVDVQASSNYVLNTKSRQISDVDFGKGNYTWTGLVYPKSDFHIRLKDDSYNYKLIEVTPGSAATLTAEIRGIKKPGDLELALVFPPGDGTMYVTGVTVEELKEP